MSRGFQHLSWQRLVLVLLILLGVFVSAAGPHPSASAAASATPPSAVEESARGDAGAPIAEEAQEPEDIRQLKRRALQIRQLISGELGPGVRAAQLFDVDLLDERAVLVEVERLGRILAEPESFYRGNDAGVEAPDDKAQLANQKQAKPAEREPKDAGPDDAGDGSAADAGDEAPAEVDPALFEARLDLDRARHEFLSLPKKKREEILAAHAQRALEASKARDTQEAISRTEETKAEAEEEQRRALEEAAAAKTEILRLLNQERARLLGVRVKQADYERQLLEREKKLDNYGETKLEWQRKTDEFLEQRARLKSLEAEADVLYFQIRTVLRSTRETAKQSVGGLSVAGDDVPDSGDDKVDSSGVDLDRAEYDKLREQVVTQASLLRKQARQLHWREAKTLLETIESLNKNRLAVFAEMSGDQRASLTSFHASGVDQAQAEFDQVALVVRYHILAAIHWKDDPATSGARQVFATIALIKVLVILLVLLWWRRRAEAVLLLLEKRARRAPPDGIHHKWGVGAFATLRSIRGPLEWLLAWWIGLAVVGHPVDELLEVRILDILISWVLAGAVIVLLVDSFAARNQAERAVKSSVPGLRLKTLRVLGRIIVFFGCLLGLSSELVGKGTLYDWVLGACFLSIIPVLLLLVGWWRTTIFERLAQRQNRSPFAAWAIRNRTGYRSFFTAAIGGVYLLGLGAVQLGRDYFTTMTLVRRVLAYLFRRELTKKAESQPKLTHISADIYDALGPSHLTSALVPTVADTEFRKIEERIAAAGGGVFAVVGERGSGKSTLLGRVAENHPGSIYLRCPPGGALQLREQLCARLGLPLDAANSEISESLSRMETDNALVIDDAQHLARAKIGGLARLDEFLALARDASSVCSWLFAFDSTVFELVERARGIRPVFDEVIQVLPWSEESIAELLEQRTQELELEPSFELLAPLTLQGDEFERLEQLRRTKRGYFRLLWDYSAGNPAVALHFWRKSLGLDESGVLQVGLFRAPSTHDLEALPDQASFVLRAIVRLEPASIPGIVETTQLSRAQVLDAIRYADFRGYLKRDEVGRLSITWTWYRAITRVLSRRRLLNIPV